MADLRFVGVHKRYGQVQVVQGIDLQVADGEFLVLVGPSGCGKSTLLRMIAGLEDISDGELWIGNRMVNRVSPRERDVAMVFQSYALYPHMTVRQNLAFGLEVRGESRALIDERIGQAAQSLGIGGYLDRYPRQLSGGQRQRVAMGRALVRRPQVFLFDEPLSNLDAALRGEVRVELKRLHQEQRTTSVYVTHDQVEALTLADRIVLLHQGRIQQIGRPEELYDRPANRFVAGFIGAPAMNFVEVQKGLAGCWQACGLDLAWPGLAEGVLPAKALLGVRPQDLDLVDSGHAPIQARVDVIEPLGSEAYVHARLTDGSRLATPISFRADPARGRLIRPGDRIGLKLEPSRGHLFDPLNGLRIDSTVAQGPRDG